MADNSEVLLLKVQAIVEGQASLVALASDLKQLETSQVAAAKAQAAATEQLSRQLGDFAAHQAQVAAQTQQLSQARLAAAERLIGISNQQTAILHQEAAATAQLGAQVAALPVKQIQAATTATAMGTTFLSVDAIVRRLTQGFELASQALGAVLHSGFEDDRFEAQFTILTGSVDAAEARLAHLREFASTLNLDFHGVVEADAILQRVGITGPRALQAVADAAAASGKSLSTVAEALAGVSRGNLRGFLDLVPAASSAVQKANAEIEAGAKKTPEAIHYLVNQALADLERFQGGAARMSTSTSAELVGLGNQFDEFRGRIYDAGLDEAVREVLGTVIDEFKRLKADGTLDAWVRGIGDLSKVAGAKLSDFIKLVTDLAEHLDDLRAPAGFLLGAVALQKLSGLVLLATVQFVDFAASAAAAGESVSLVGFAVESLGGPVGIAIGLVGGLIGAMVFDNARGQVDTLRASYAHLDEQLAQNARRAPAEDPGLGNLMSQADQATEAVRRLHEERDSLGRETPLELIDSTALLTLDAATTKMRGLADEVARAKRGGIDREAPVAPPTAAVRDARNQLAADYAFTPGESFADFQKRTGRTTQERAEKPPKPPVDEDALKRAFDAAVRSANQLLSETEKVSKEATDIVLKQIEKRLDASGAEGEARLRLLQQYSVSEQAMLLSSGALREQLETELAQRIAQRRAEIAATGSSAAVQSRLNADLDAEAAAGQRAIDIAFTTGRAEAAVRKGVAEESAKERQDIEQRMSRDRAKQALEDARFERDLFGQTAEQYAISLRRRLADLNQYSLESKAIADELAKAQKAADEESLARITRAAVARRPGESVGEADQRIQAGDRVRDNAEASSNADKDNLDADYAARVEFYAKLLNVHHQTFEEMTLFERQQYALALQGASSFYGALRLGAAGSYRYVSDQVKKTLGDEQTRFALLGFLTQKGSKEAIAAAAEQAQGELKVRALVWAAEAIAAAATGQFTKAAGLAEAAALAGVGVAVTGAIARSERASIADDQRNAAANDQAAGTTRSASDTRLAVSQANQPITMYFYNSVSFEGGTVFLDRAGARQITDMLTDSINEAIETGKIRVR